MHSTRNRKTRAQSEKFAMNPSTLRDLCGPTFHLFGDNMHAVSAISIFRMQHSGIIQIDANERIKYSQRGTRQPGKTVEICAFMFSNPRRPLNMCIICIFVFDFVRIRCSLIFIRAIGKTIFAGKAGRFHCQGFDD